MCQIFPPVIYHKHFRYKDRVALERIQITIDSKIANNFAFSEVLRQLHQTNIL